MQWYIKPVISACSIGMVGTVIVKNIVQCEFNMNILMRQTQGNLWKPCLNYRVPLFSIKDFSKRIGKHFQRYFGSTLSLFKLTFYLSYPFLNKNKKGKFTSPLIFVWTIIMGLSLEGTHYGFTRVFFFFLSDNFFVQTLL